MQPYQPGQIDFSDLKLNGDKKSHYESPFADLPKYSTLGPKNHHDVGMGMGMGVGFGPSIFTSQHDPKYNTIGPAIKTNYFDDGHKVNGGYDAGPNIMQHNASLLGVEDTPTPTSSIETEDSATREVGEKDVEGDGEQSD